MTWQEVRDVFELDGMLRDLYIFDTNIETWQRALDLLHSGNYPLSYNVDSKMAELPGEVAAIFSKREEAMSCLSVDVHVIRINCHFFLEEQIEFDIDPREVNNEARFNHLWEFISWLGRGLGRSVILTPEGGEDEVLIRYLPATDDFEHVGSVLIEHPQRRAG